MDPISDTVFAGCALNSGLGKRSRLRRNSWRYHPQMVTTGRAYDETISPKTKTRTVGVSRPDPRNRPGSLGFEVIAAKSLLLSQLPYKNDRSSGQHCSAGSSAIGLGKPPRAAVSLSEGTRCPPIWITESLSE